MFCFDSIVRSPSELMGLKVEDISIKPNGEVWVTIPQEITKTFERTFNLVYCGEEMKKFIEEREPEEELFTLSYLMFLKELQKVAKQIFGNKKSLGGSHYKDIRFYDRLRIIML